MNKRKQRLSAITIFYIKPFQPFHNHHNFKDFLSEPQLYPGGRFRSFSPCNPVTSNDREMGN